jgi:hypothetical protein
MSLLWIQLEFRHTKHLTNISFVKDVQVVGKKMARNGRKMAIYES